MEWWQAILLGLVEGVTEYLPVSSTGHLLVLQRALGLPQDEAANTFAICIQAGAIVAVLGLYRRRVGSMARGFVGRDPAGRRLLALITVAFVPAAVLGLSTHEWIEARLFGIQSIVAAWFVGGATILIVERLRRRRRREERPGFDVEQLDALRAFGIGLAQCAALWPGTSRSLATIVGGVLIGLSLTAAVEFSFLLGAVTLLAATAYKALDGGGAMLEAYSPLSIAQGFLAAWVAALISVKWMVGYLQRHGLALFGWYRVALALGVGVAVGCGLL